MNCDSLKLNILQRLHFSHYLRSFYELCIHFSTFDWRMSFFLKKNCCFNKYTVHDNSTETETQLHLMFFFFHKNSDEDNKRITCLFGCSIKSNAILMLPSRCTVLNEEKNHLLSNRKQFFSYFKFREKTRLFCEWSNNCVIS